MGFFRSVQGRPASRIFSNSCKPIGGRATPQDITSVDPRAAFEVLRQRAAADVLDLECCQPVAIQAGVAVCAPTGTPLMPIVVQPRVIAT